MEEPKLELKTVNNQLSQLDLVKARAELRTKRRIAEILDKQKMKELEIQVAHANKAGITEKKGK